MRTSPNTTTNLQLSQYLDTSIVQLSLVDGDPLVHPTPPLTWSCWHDVPFWSHNTPNCLRSTDPPSHHVLIGTSTSVCRCPYLSTVHTPNPTISFLSVDCCFLPNHLVFTPSSASGEPPVLDPSPGNLFATHVMSFCSFFILSHLLSHHLMFIIEFVSLFWLLLSSLPVRRINGSRGVSRHNALYGCGYVPLVIRWHDGQAGMTITAKTSSQTQKLTSDDVRAGVRERKKRRKTSHG